MSMLNRMLRDLEQRQSASLAVQGGVLESIASVEEEDRERSERRRHLLLSGLVLCLAGLSGYWLFPDDEGSTVAMETAAGQSAVPGVHAKANGRVGDAGSRTENTVPATLQMATNLSLQQESSTSEAQAAENLMTQAVIAAKPEQPLAMTEIKATVEQPPARVTRSLRQPVVHSKVSAAGSNRPLIKSPSSPVSPAQQAMQSFELGSTLLQKGQTQQGIEKLQQALSLDAGLVEARVLLAAVLMDNGQLELAGRVIAEGFIGGQPEPRLLVIRARLMVAKGMVTEAVALLDSHQPDISQARDYYALQATLLRREGQHARAAQVYRQLLEQEPRAGKWWTGLGISLESVADFSGALTAFRNAQIATDLSASVLQYVNSRVQSLEQIAGQ